MTLSGIVADHQWAGRWVPAGEALRQAQGTNRQAQGASSAIRIRGTVVPGLRDHHVHLGLVDRDELAGSNLSAVDDLGWIRDEVLGWKAARLGGCTVRAAGPFLTAPGGYPSGRAWAPDEAVVAIGSAETGAAVVRELAAAGVDLIKVALHTGMPLLTDEALQAIVTAAHERGLPVVVHAEGVGQAARAAAGGADALAHTPWTETLSDELLSAMVGRLTWISTLAIHPSGEQARAIAADNLTRFVAVGGRVRYGTDMGNGPTPAGLNLDELEALVAAGLDIPMIVNALCRPDPDPAWMTWTSLDPPEEVTDLPPWCATLRRRPLSDFADAS